MPDVDFNIRDLKRSDPRIYEMVFKRYYPVLLLYIERQVGDRDVAKDIVQDIFFKLYEGRRSFPEDFNLKPWFYRVARNAALDYIRHLKVVDNNKCLVAESILYTSEADEAMDEEIYERINNAIARLPEQCRLIIHKSVVENKKYQEIAEELDISINTIKTQISRGYRKLREMLTEENEPLILFFYLNLKEN